MKRPDRLLPPFLLSLALACGERSPEEAEPPPSSASEAPRAPEAPAPEAAPSRTAELAWEMRTVERTAPEPPRTAVTLSYPEFMSAASEEAKQALNRYVRELVLASAVGEGQAASPEAVADEVLRDNKRAYQEDPDITTTWTLERSVEVVHHTPRVISLKAAESSFLGGAHPNSSVTYASFDPATGRRIALADLFLPSVDEKLREVAERKFREAREIPPDRDLAEEGFEFEGGSFALNDNFAVVEDGLVFYYDPYEIAAYAMGPTEVKLTREDLAGLVRPGGPLGS